MPYASSIKIVNDANGTAYAFLEDNGSLWQCQWNPEALRWDKAQIVPGAYGGEKLQALLVENLWPTTSKEGVKGSKPGLVLAYRLGKGAQAEVFASLAQWTSEGELSWSSPVQLSNDQLEDQDLALSAGPPPDPAAGPAGSFTLVAQKQQAGTPLTALLDQLKASPSADLANQLKAAASGEQPDSDLSATIFQVVSDPQAPDSGQLVLQNQTTNTFSPALSAAPPAQPLPTAPLAFSGNTQISRQLLFTPAPIDAALQATGLGGSTPTQWGKLKIAGQKTYNNGSALRFGALFGQGLLRWQLPLRAEEIREESSYESIKEESSYESIKTEEFDEDAELQAALYNKQVIKRVRSSSEIVSSISKESESLIDPASRRFSSTVSLGNIFSELNASAPGSSLLGLVSRVEKDPSSEVNGPSWRITGLLGNANIGAGGPTTFSTFKWQPKTWGDSDSINITSRLRPDEILVSSGHSAGFGGNLRTIFQYQQGLPPGLTSLTANESIGGDWESYTHKLFENGGGSFIVSHDAYIGGLLSQSLRSLNGDTLPTWLGTIGYIGGLVADAEAKIIRTLKGRDISKQQKDAKKSGDEVPGNQGYGINLQDANSKKTYLAFSNAVAGTLLAAVGPAAALTAATKGWRGDSSNFTFDRSYGFDASVRLTLRLLYKSVAGVQATIADNFSYNLFGTDRFSGENELFLNAGIATPLGGSIPLVSYYWNAEFGADTTPQEPDPAPNNAPPASATSSTQGGYLGANTGSQYPFGYVPQSGDIALPSSSSSTNPANPSLLGGQARDLQLLTLLPTIRGQVNSSQAGGNYPLTLTNPGVGLVNGDWTDVAIMGVTIDGQPASAAKASFSVENGSIDPASFQITAAGDYLALPLARPDSGVYALVLDVFSKGIAVAPLAGSPAPGNAFAAMPLLTLDSSKINISEVLKTQAVQRLTAVPVPKVDPNQTATVSYPRYDPTTKTVIPVDSRDNSPYIYKQVPVTLFASSAPTTPISLLDPAAPTATVTLSGGAIVAVALNAPLLFPANSGTSGDTYSLQLTLPEAVQSSLDPALASPTYSVDPQALGLANFVADEQFSAQAGAQQAGVYLAAGLSDQLPLIPAMGTWPVQNRVTYVSTTGSGSSAKSEVHYLNGNRPNDLGTLISVADVSPSELSLEEIYSDPGLVFSAASNPTAVTIATSNKLSSGDVVAGAYNGNTLVAWVEASDPVIPVSSPGDGSSNYQAFMEALYGNQRLNYRINLGGSEGWQAPKLDDLYYPDQAVIRDLKAMTVANPISGGPGTLLVWTEASLPAIKGEVESISSGELGAPPPAVIKTVWLNPNANDYQPSALFSNADGSVRGFEAITVIPWSPEADVGLTIEDIAIASQPRVQADGSLASTAVVSWSQEVRTPYRQSVLNDEPLLFLPLDNLESGANAINIGQIQSASTATFASATGLDFTIAGALPKANATAVQNSDGTGVLSTGLGTGFRTIRQLLSNVPASDLAASADPIAQFTASVSGTTLSVSAVSAGLPAVGDLLTGPGILAGTRISKLDQVDASTGVGTYVLDRSQTTLDSAPLEAIPQPVQLPFSSFSGSIAGTTLTVSGISEGTLRVGDIIGGPGVAPTTAIVAIDSFDTTSGTGTFQLNTNQSLPPSALVALPGPATTPYTIEFWAQLQPNSNPAGAGLVALGQPSEAAIGAATRPDGWLLNSNFVVEKLTYNQAAAQGLIGEDVLAGVSNPDTTTYGWQWTVQATGANTTALNGTGGSNLYANALLLSNLNSGVRLEGVDQFLASYNLSAADLVGLGGADAATIANVPLTQLQFSNDIDPASGRPNSSLNGIAIDTSTSLLNQGVVVANGAADALSSMLDALWQFQQATGEAKVNFSLAPESPAPSGQPPANQQENYAGYALDFALTPGSAISVNGNGQLVFDVADGVTLTSSATASLAADLRDGRWHHIVAAYLPTYQTYITSDGVTVSLPTNMGTASLTVDNQLVGSQSMVLDAYKPINSNDQADLLVNNAGGALDLLAIYDKALTSSAFSPDLSGNWPQPSEQDALQLFKTLGYSLDTKTADQGAISGAISRHWLARNVNPNAAALATYTSSFDASSGAWSTAVPLNAALETEASSTSYSRSGSLQEALVIDVPSTNWTQSNWAINTQANQFWDPAGKKLTGVKVTLNNQSDTSQAPVTISLRADQVLMGAQTLGSLQQQNGSTPNGNLAYTFLSNTPALQLIIPKEQLPASKGQELRDQYNATYSFDFSQGGTVSTVSTAAPVDVNTAGYTVATAASGNQANQATISSFVQTNSQAIATAEVLEAAPLQLKYIDSGVVLKSAASAADASNPATSSPANSFGQSQVVGFFKDSDKNRQGWLAVAQPFSTNANSNPAGRVWIQYTGQSANNQPSADPSKAPNTWLNALARSNFTPDAANLPLLGDAEYPSNGGGLLIQADPTAGWGQNFGQTMLVADVNNDGNRDLIIAAPQANGGGRVVIIDGAWISANLIANNGNTILNLANPNEIGPHVTILTPTAPTDPSDDIAVANFGLSLAFDPSTNKLWIGAPNYLRQLNSAAPSLASLQAIGALYAYTPTDVANSWGSGLPTAISPIALGSGGTITSLDGNGSSITSYWGSRLGSALAFDGQGAIAVSAPGVQASLLYSGSEVVQQQAEGKRNPSDPYGDGALIKLQLPVQASGNSQLPDVSSVEGSKNSELLPVANQSIDPHSDLAKKESTYMQNLRQLQQDAIAPATYLNNQAIQTGAVGAVYLLKSQSTLLTLGQTINAQSVAQANGATFYGAMPWNTLGDSGFGSSLSFGDLTDSNHASVLAIGAPQTGGSGALYLIETDRDFTAAGGDQPSWMQSINLLDKDTQYTNQYLAYLASSLTLYGEAIGDNFASGLTELGDVNAVTGSSTAYDDLLIQAFNAGSGAGNGYLLFGDDQLLTSSSTGAPIPATGSVATGAIGQFKRADGQSFSTAILSELGHGGIGYTGQGTFGKGDSDGDGINDIPLGSGPNGEAYITKGQIYLEAISNLQLQKLASNTGYLLDGLATTTQGSLRSIGDFNGDGYGDFISVQPGALTDTVRIELGANTEEILADYPYNFYSFQVAPGTQVLPGGDINGDGFSDIALFLQQNLSTAAEGNAGAGSTTGILYGRLSNQLPMGSSFGLLAPVDAGGNVLAQLPSRAIPGALSTQAPAMLAVGNTIYAVWCDKLAGSTNLWFALSRDGGTTWSTDTNLSAAIPALASSSTPSLAFRNERLYLAFRNSAGQLALSSWDANSGNPLLWSNPTVLAAGSTTLTSDLSPTLIDNGDALSLVWLDPTSQALEVSFTTTPDLSSSAGSIGVASSWNAVNNGTSPNTPALVNEGNTVYMAMRGENNQLYWNASGDGGQSWRGWQELPSDMLTNDAPSLAILNGSLYLTYLGAGNQQINITQLTDAGTNGWSTQTVLGQTANNGQGAVVIGESVNGTEGLAIYYVANNSTGTILRTWSSDPSNESSWSRQQTLGSTAFTSSGQLAVTRFQGNTVLAYLGGTPGSPSNTAYIATAGSSPENVSNWTTIATRDTGNRLGINLSSDAGGVLLNTSDSGTGQQAIYRLTPQSSSSTWSQSFETSRASISSTAPTAALLALQTTGSTPQLLLAAADKANAGEIDVSVFYPEALNSSWSSATALLERVVDSNGTVSFQPISATTAPSATLLNGAPVLAVNNNGSLNVYIGNGGKTFSLASSFSAGSSPAGLTTTDTGLALSYRNSDGSVSLQRLKFLQPDGTPVDGVVINADGSIDTSNANLQWQGIDMGPDTGLSTALATSPLSVNGTLLLGSTSNASASTNTVQLNAIPVLSNPESTTWLNSTVQLPDGQGGWMLQQQAGNNEPIDIGPINPGWQPIGGFQSPDAPAVTDLNGILYAVARGQDSNIYLATSNDNGLSWTSWKMASNTDGTSKPPTIASFSGQLYICYIRASDNNLMAIRYDPSSQVWGDSINIGSQKGQFLTAINEENNLFTLFYLGSNDELYYTTATSPGKKKSWTNSASIKDSSGNAQTASGPLAAARLNNTTYLAYQGGTPGDPEAQIYLTTGAVANNNNKQNWTVFKPQFETGAGPTTSSTSKTVGLTANQDGLVLSYSDLVDGKNALVLDQGRGSGTSWTFEPFTTLAQPNNTTASLTSATVASSSTSQQVLALSLGTSNNFNSALVSLRPSSLVLNSVQSGSALSAIGDINVDGYDDLLVIANNVVQKQVNQADVLSTGLRLILGTASGATLASRNDASASSQTVQIGPGFGLNSTTPAASLSGMQDGAAQLTVTSADTGSGRPFSLSSDIFNLDGFTANAGDLLSAQKTFSSATTPGSDGTGLGLGFGVLGLNTTETFGDLNADGYLDYLDGNPTTVYGADGLGWNVWSIRAAGDVNGNGTDDVMLSLVPPEAVLNGAPQWIQPVLVDGALFEVNKDTNSFSLEAMRAPLNPYGRLQLQDQNATTATQPWPLLQNWLTPILSFTPSSGSSSATIDSPSPASTSLPGLTGGAGQQATVATAYGSSGKILLISGSMTADGINQTGFPIIQISRGSTDGTSTQWTAGIPGEVLSRANSGSSSDPHYYQLSPSGAAIFDGYLYVALSSANYLVSGVNGELLPEDDGEMSLFYIKESDLTPGGIADASRWNHYQLPGRTSLKPALVNEGDRLGLYYVSDNNKQNILYSYSENPQLGNTNWKTANDDGLIYSNLNGTDTAIQLSNTGQTQNIAATRFRDTTYIAFSGQFNNSHAVYIAKQPDNYDPNSTSGWTTSSEISNTEPGLIFLSANDSQLALVTTNLTGSNNPFGVHLYNSIGSSPASATLRAGANATVVGASTIGGQLHLQTQSTQFLNTSIGLQAVATPWTSASQKSLAGYSIDGNIDLNGDGFMDMVVSDPSDPSRNVDNQYALFGGDYLNIASQVGTPGDDVMIGTPLADVIYSIQGADQVTSNGGADVIVTGAGDDAISIKDNAFIRIDAGSGFDQLLLQGLANQSYDFRLNVPNPEYFSGTKLRDIEQISSIDYGANLLSFDAAAINAINPDRVLFVTPDASDSIALSSEFARNANFDTSFGGTLWSAYAAAPQSATPASANPALLYVRTPTGQTSDWLSSQVSTTATAPALSPSGQSGEPLASLPTPSPIADSQAFGKGFTLLAYREASGADAVRFAIERSDTRKRQTVLYHSSSQNSSAEPGRHYGVVAGLLTFAIGEQRKDITVPIDAAAFAALRRGSVSLSVEELQDLGQRERHLLFRPAAAPDGALPVLSGFDFSVDPSSRSAQLSFRADVNNGSGSPNTLRFQVGQRSSADAAAPPTESLSTLALLDAVVSDSSVPPAYNSDPAAYALDTDQRHNAQVTSQMTLDLMAQGNDSALFLSGPALRWSSPASSTSDGSLSFDQTVNLSAWRADQGTGAVDFALVSGDRRVSLLENASGGSAGAITPDAALDPGSSGWRSTEGKAVGSQAALSNLNLTGSTWTPTASRDGQQLALQDLQVDGNWINARFEGGVSLQLFLDAITSAPTPTAVRPQVDIQRLAGQDNGIGFYPVDAITGAVDGLNPGDSGYLEAALRRSEAADLLLEASELPAFGQERTYRELALDPNQQYGVLLLVDGSRELLFSSFAAANPGGAPQMLSLGSDSNGMVLGIEDLSVIGGRSDGDSNDLILRLGSVNVAVL